MKIATKHDLEAFLADTTTHETALAHLQALVDERYQFGPDGTWGTVEPNGLTRLGLTVAEAVALGAVDREIAEPEYSGPPLEEAKAAACAAIDAEAERRRLLVITPGAGQALEYQHTAEEAARVVAAPDPLIAAAYPFLAAEQTALASTVGEIPLRDVAVAVLADRAAWLAYGAAIKAVRRKAKMEINAATTPADVAAVAAGVTWPETVQA